MGSSESKDSARDGRHVLERLPREDQDLIVEFVLCSGSLKDLAKRYGVSYPTIRNRLDGVIGRVRGLMEGREPDAVVDLLARLVARGELSASGARLIRAVVAEERNGRAE